MNHVSLVGPTTQNHRLRLILIHFLLVSRDSPNNLNQHSSTGRLVPLELTRFAKFCFRFSQPPIDDGGTKNLMYSEDMKEKFFMGKLFHYFFHPKHAVQGH